MRVLDLLATIPEAAVPEHSIAVADSSDHGDAQSLVVEFDEAYTAFVEGFEQLPSESQMIALQAVDTKLSAMVGAKDAVLWTTRARREDRVWVEVREIVADVFERFAWSASIDVATVRSANSPKRGDRDDSRL